MLAKGESGSTVTCASCGQLFFGDCSLKSPGFSPTAWNLQKERRDDFSGRGGRCQSFSISIAWKFTSTSRPESHLDRFRSSPSHALMQVMRDLAAQRLRHTFGAANCSCAYILGLFYPILEARIFAYIKLSPFTRLSYAQFGIWEGFPLVGRLCLFNERKLILDQIAAEAVTSLHCGRRWFSSHLRIRASHIPLAPEWAVRSRNQQAASNIKLRCKSSDDGCW
jgi:hypothetical protein